MTPLRSTSVLDGSNQGWAFKNGKSFYQPEAYPNSVAFSRYFPVHYDPVKDGFKTKSALAAQKPSNLQGDHKLVLEKQELPRACQRYLNYYQRCLLVNGEKKCDDAVNDVLEICPTWALESIKDGRRKLKKYAAIQEQQYREALTVPEYNKGRTVADVSQKTFIHGTRKYLRPDTIWADERYSDVTLEEIAAAKVRHEARLKSQGKALVGPLQHVDTHIDPNHFYEPKQRHIYAQPLEKH